MKRSKLILQGCRGCGKSSRTSTGYCQLCGREARLQARFWSKVRKTEKCWEWAQPVTNEGYGRFWFKGKDVTAHRFSYLHNVGEIPDGMNVLHRCDNPKCVRPDHLFLGTLGDNMQDMLKKGRKKNAKLTPEEAKAIRICRKKGIEAQVLAEKFAVSIGTVYVIATGRTWGKVTEEVTVGSLDSRKANSQP